jgi:hypothetical protein
MSPRRLGIVAVLVMSWGIFGIILLAWPLPSAPTLSDDPQAAFAAADGYAQLLLGSTLAGAFDPEGHDALVVERRDAQLRPVSPTSAFLLLDSARRHAEATVFSRWVAIFAFGLCVAGGALGLWRAQRAGRAEREDPGPSVNLEAVGFAIAAMLVSSLLVGWTAKITSTIVTLYCGFACAALMIAGRVMPRSMAAPATRTLHIARIVGGLVLVVGGIVARRTMAAPGDASGGEIVIRALPMLVASCVMVVGTVLAASNAAMLVLHRAVAVRPARDPDRIPTIPD